MKIFETFVSHSAHIPLYCLGGRRGTHVFHHLGLLNDSFQGNVGSTNLLGDTTCLAILYVCVSQLEIKNSRTDSHWVK